MKRQFKLKSELIGDQRVAVHRITCAKCQHSETMSSSRGGNPFPIEAIARHFRLKGWEVSDREGEDACPACVEKEQVARRKVRLRVVQKKTAAAKVAAAKPETKDQPMPSISTTAPVEAAPVEVRFMSRDDRRIIFGTLDRAYIDADKGYRPGWNDARVCADLGVPAEWVRTIREEMFGPEGENAETRKAVEDMNAAMAEAQKVHAEMMALADKHREVADHAEAQARNIAALLTTLSVQATRLTAALT